MGLLYTRRLRRTFLVLSAFVTLPGIAREEHSNDTVYWVNITDSALTLCYDRPLFLRYFPAGIVLVTVLRSH